MQKPTTFQYVSTVRGVEEEQTGGSYVYYGLVFTVPKKMLLPENGARYARLTDRHYEEMEELIKEISRDTGTEGEVGDVLERYEVFGRDRETVHIMLRVPFRVRADYQARVPGNRLMQCRAEKGTLVLGQGDISDRECQQPSETEVSHD